MKGDILSSKGRFGPLTEDHPSMGDKCPLCEIELKVGDIPALLEIEPADEKEAQKARDGKPYTAEAQIAHEVCVYPEEYVPDFKDLAQHSRRSEELFRKIWAILAGISDKDRRSRAFTVIVHISNSSTFNPVYIAELFVTILKDDN